MAIPADDKPPPEDLGPVEHPEVVIRREHDAPARVHLHTRAHRLREVAVASGARVRSWRPLGVRRDDALQLEGSRSRTAPARAGGRRARSRHRPRRRRRRSRHPDDDETWHDWPFLLTTCTSGAEVRCAFCIEVKAPATAMERTQPEALHCCRILRAHLNQCLACASARPPARSTVCLQHMLRRLRERAYIEERKEVRAHADCSAPLAEERAPLRADAIARSSVWLNVHVAKGSRRVHADSEPR